MALQMCTVEYVFKLKREMRHNIHQLYSMKVYIVRSIWWPYMGVIWFKLTYSLVSPLVNLYKSQPWGVFKSVYLPDWAVYCLALYKWKVVSCSFETRGGREHEANQKVDGLFLEKRCRCHHFDIDRYWALFSTTQWGHILYNNVHLVPT